MQERSIPSADLLLATSRVLGRLLLVWCVIAIGKALLFYLFDLGGANAIFFAILFGAVFFAAPLAVSALRTRKRIRLSSRSGRKTLVFCFVWGSVAVSIFLAALQLAQDMAATSHDYILAMICGGAFCAATSCIPNRS